MKNITTLFLLIALAFIFSEAKAQQSVVGGKIISEKARVPFIAAPSTYPKSALLPSEALEASELAISYFDPTAQRMYWVVPAQFDQYLILALGERITLPGSTGYLDSLVIGVDTVTSDSIAVVLMPDTLFETQNGFFHIMNIFDNSVEPYGVGVIYKENTHTGQPVTVSFPHVQVPKEFFVMIAPRIDQTTQTFANAYRIISDVALRRPRTTENTRSGMLLLDGVGNTLSTILDSTLQPTGFQEPVSANFMITAYVDTASALNAVKNNGRATDVVRVYPNPFSSSFTISLEGITASSSLRLFDAVGREVRDFTSEVRAGNKQVSFYQKGLPNGTYYLQCVGEKANVIKALTLSK